VKSSKQIGHSSASSASAADDDEDDDEDEDDDDDNDDDDDVDGKDDEMLIVTRIVRALLVSKHAMVAERPDEKSMISDAIVADAFRRIAPPKASVCSAAATPAAAEMRRFRYATVADAAAASGMST
jgi:hypothetical protein